MRRWSRPPSNDRIWRQFGLAETQPQGLKSVESGSSPTNTRPSRLRRLRAAINVRLRPARDLHNPQDNDYRIRILVKLHRSYVGGLLVEQLTNSFNTHRCLDL